MESPNVLNKNEGTYCQKEKRCDAGNASDGSSGTISVDDNHYKTATLNGRFVENKDIAMGPTNSTLALSKGRRD